MITAVTLDVLLYLPYTIISEAEFLLGEILVFTQNLYKQLPPLNIYFICK
jgi:hypothetical protein